MEPARARARFAERTDALRLRMLRPTPGLTGRDSFAAEPCH